MSNAALNPSIIAKEIAYQVKNNLKFAGSCVRAYESQWQNQVNGWQVGQSIDIRVPAQYTVGTTASISAAQDIIQVKRSLSLNQRRNTLIQMTSAEMTYTFSRFQEEIAAPAGIRLANAIDAYMASLAETYVAQTYASTVGTVNSLGHVYGARQYLVNAGAPADGENYVAMHPNHVASLMPVVGTVFNSGFTDPILKDGAFGRFAGCTFWESQNTGIHTYGAKAAATNVLNAAYTFATNPTSGTIAQGTIAITGDAATVRAGDTFTLAGVYGVKPLSEGGATSTGQLKQFVVATAATGASGATTNVIFYEGAIGAGPYQNVTGASGSTLASVASNTAVTFTGGTGGQSAAQSLMYNKNWAALAVVPLAMPDSCAWGARETVDGISVRLTKGWANDADVETTRVDVLFGGLVLNPALAVKII